MSTFPRQIIVDFENIKHLPEAIEVAIDEALSLHYGNYTFELLPQGITWGVGSTNFAYFDVENCKELDVRKLIYENNG